MRREDQNPTSIIFQRLQAQESLRELQRERSRQRFAANVRTIWSERTFLVRISAVGLLAGILVAFLIPTHYISTTRLMPPDNESGSSVAVMAATLAAGGSGGLGQIAGDLLGVKNSSDVFAEILASRTLQDHLIQKFDLKRVYGVSKMIDARRELSLRATIGVDRKTQMISISVSDRSPQRAAEISAAYIDELNNLVSDLSTSSARRERIFLEARLGQVNQDLEKAEQEFSRFANKSGAIDIKEQGKAILEVAGTFQGQLISAQTELEGLRQIYSDSHVRVRAQKARVAELQAQLSRLGGKDQGNTVGPDTAAADLYPSIRKLPLLGVTYADLYRRTKVQEAVYEVLTQEYELAKIQEAREIPIVRVLDAPEVPEKRGFPPRRLIVASSTGLAFISGIVIVLGTKNWDERDPNDLGKALAKEIWIDLKEKRFLNSVAHPTAAPHSQASMQLKRGIFFLLGWNKGLRNGNGSSLSSARHSSGRASDPDRSENSGPTEEQGLRGTA